MAIPQSPSGEVESSKAHDKKQPEVVPQLQGKRATLGKMEEALSVIDFSSKASAQRAIDSASSPEDALKNLFCIDIDKALEVANKVDELKSDLPSVFASLLASLADQGIVGAKEFKSQLSPAVDSPTIRQEIKELAAHPSDSIEVAEVLVQAWNHLLGETEEKLAPPPSKRELHSKEIQVQLPLFPSKYSIQDFLAVHEGFEVSSAMSKIT
mmetsp:Transcript_19056/g.29241  ORF Transcript_19056/g.29241 Transcript_19056/m.29241 type:complete len:211 (-) Transcript_19056:172-804(-)